MWGIAFGLVALFVGLVVVFLAVAELSRRVSDLERRADGPRAGGPGACVSQSIRVHPQAAETLANPPFGLGPP